MATVEAELLDQELSADDSLAPDGLSDCLYEVIDGQIVELPPMGNQQEITANILHIELAIQIRAKRIGHAVMEMLFDFTQQVGKKRRPDVAFVSSQKWPYTKPIDAGDGWKVVPNLAVEVISPSNTWDDVNDKIEEYFHVGVERVWVVSTNKKQVHVYTSPTEVRILAGDDVLTDEQLLPEFKLTLPTLFEMVPD